MKVFFLEIVIKRFGANRISSFLQTIALHMDYSYFLEISYKKHTLPNISYTTVEACGHAAPLNLDEKCMLISYRSGLVQFKRPKYLVSTI
jgi:hypothetical protein